MSKYVRVVTQIVILFLYSFLGTFIVQSLHIKFPGSIAGLLLLLLSLHFKIIPVNLIRDGAGFLLAIFPLFFIPATVGVMNYPELVSLQGLLLVFTVIISTIFTIGVSGRICQYMENKESAKETM